MQYEAAKSELRSPPKSLPFMGMLFEAAGLLLITGLLFWLI
jgi:hypothetical protein